MNSAAPLWRFAVPARLSSVSPRRESFVKSPIKAHPAFSPELDCKPNLLSFVGAGLIIALCFTAAIPSHGQTFTTLATFSATNGASPYAGLVQGSNGNFYGTTSSGGKGSWGTVFEVTSSGSLTTLHNFSGGKDGGSSYAGLMQASNGNLYGTTTIGGSNCAHGYSCGTIFEANTAGDVFTIYSFCSQTNSEGVCVDGSIPYAPLVEAANKGFYGTTAVGGVNNYGTVFEVSSQGKLTSLYSFCSKPKCEDGSNPYAGLLQASDHNLYGTTTTGGRNGNGTVFGISYAGKLKKIYDFCSQPNCADGAIPQGSLVQAANGNFYGVTNRGGTSTYCSVSYGCGTVFELTPQGALTTLYNFCSQPDCADGYAPAAGLTLGSDGNFYGTTIQAGANVYGGTIFKLTPEGAETTLYNFEPTDGGDFGGLVQGADGAFYGATAYGGGGGNCSPGGCGTAFSFSQN